MDVSQANYSNSEKKDKHNTNNEIEKCLQDPTEHIPAHQAVTDVLTQSAAPYNFSHRFQIYPKDFKYVHIFNMGLPSYSP